MISIIIADDILLKEEEEQSLERSLLQNTCSDYWLLYFFNIDCLVCHF